MDISSTDEQGFEITDGQASEYRRAHLRVDDSIRDVLNHPAFAGFGPLILPWDGKTYDETMRLTNVGSLLPYHSHVNPQVVVSSLNRMIDDAGTGKPVFYDFYT